MGNALTKNMFKGTLGELLVQLRLLEFGIQAAPPLKDTGNDLIAIKGEVVKFIQIKTEGRLRNLPDIYHLIAIVDLKYDNQVNLCLDQSKIWILIKDMSLKEKRILNQTLVDEIWGS